jgi:hypothetical protein
MLNQDAAPTSRPTFSTASTESEQNIRTILSGGTAEPHDYFMMEQRFREIEKEETRQKAVTDMFRAAGVAGFLALIAATAFWYWRRQRRSRLAGPGS